MAGKTNFGKISADLNRENQPRGNLKFEKINWLSIPYGDTIFSILPPKTDDANLYEEYWLHFGFIGENGEKRVYQCSRKKHGKCPICDRVTELEKADRKDDAKDIKAQRRMLYNAADIDMNSVVVSLKPSQHKEILHEMQAMYTDNEVDITDITLGYQLKLSRLKKDPWARARVLSKQVQVTEDKVNELLTKSADLSRIYIDNTPEELQRVLNGEDVNKREIKKATEPVAEAATEEAVEEVVEEVKPAPVVKAAPKPVTKAPPAAVAKPVAKAPAPVAKAAPKPAPVAKVAVEEDEDPELKEIEDILKE